jgi:hypothetical protein
MVTPFTAAPGEVRERLEALARSPDSRTLIPPRTGGTLAGERVHAFGGCRDRPASLSHSMACSVDIRRGGGLLRSRA